MSAAAPRQSLTKRIVRAVQASAPPVPHRHPRLGKTGRAPILTPDQLNYLLHHLQVISLDPLRDFVIVLLSFKAGLRAAEIAGLDWQDVTDVMGKVGQPRINPATGEAEPFFTVRNSIAKKGHGRLIPMHPALQGALENLQKALTPAATRAHAPVIRGRRAPRISPNALVQYLISLYERAGMRGSSHSGRRTVITTLAQTANQHGCSLMDVQDIAGHANVETTETYVEASPNIGKLVRSL